MDHYTMRTIVIQYHEHLYTTNSASPTKLDDFLQITDLMISISELHLVQVVCIYLSLAEDYNI